MVPRTAGATRSQRGCRVRAVPVCGLATGPGPGHSPNGLGLKGGPHPHAPGLGSRGRGGCRNSVSSGLCPTPLGVSRALFLTRRPRAKLHWRRSGRTRQWSTKPLLAPLQRPGSTPPTLPVGLTARPPGGYTGLGQSPPRTTRILAACRLLLGAPAPPHTEPHAPTAGRAETSVSTSTSVPPLYRLEGPGPRVHRSRVPSHLYLRLRSAPGLAQPLQTSPRAQGVSRGRQGVG
ncbi:hypothetical protein NDU88_011157 [Pleurodeles waltl]|uniref:Uncharacterized protein n=1 Tax=Pleurodeles waltl TaxID=8319 RepID=A0AAV7S1P9_PLEWA|nr:hypothetical protein NDU88_011157 [Pleurodeles waltl]